MQFGGIVHSCLFVNERGDILVALSDQVALVRFQDYLPPSVLQEILAIDTWSDDVEETAKGFDSEIDVWGVYTAKPTTSSDNRVKDTESRYRMIQNHTRIVLTIFFMKELNCFQFEFGTS